MTVVVNGNAVELPRDATLAGAVAAVGRPVDGFGVAVALNGEVVPRRDWSSARLAEGDRIEVLAAAQGG